MDQKAAAPTLSVKEIERTGDQPYISVTTDFGLDWLMAMWDASLENVSYYYFN